MILAFGTMMVSAMIMVRALLVPIAQIAAIAEARVHARTLAVSTMTASATMVGQTI